VTAPRLTRKLENSRENIKDLEVRREDLKLAKETVERRLNQAHQEFRPRGSAPQRGFGKAVEAIQAAQLPGVRGVVAELGTGRSAIYHARSKLRRARACETLSLTPMQTRRNAIGYLKEQNVGRATFLPLNKMKSRALGEALRRAGSSITP